MTQFQMQGSCLEVDKLEAEGRVSRTGSFGFCFFVAPLWPPASLCCLTRLCCITCLCCTACVCMLDVMTCMRACCLTLARLCGPAAQPQSLRVWASFSTLTCLCVCLCVVAGWLQYDEATRLSADRLESQLHKVQQTIQDDREKNMETPYALIIDGKALLYALSPRLRQLFLEVRQGAWQRAAANTVKVTLRFQAVCVDIYGLMLHRLMLHKLMLHRLMYA